MNGYCVHGKEDQCAWLEEMRSWTVCTAGSGLGNIYGTDNRERTGCLHWGEGGNAQQPVGGESLGEASAQHMTNGSVTAWLVAPAAQMPWTIMTLVPLESFRGGAQSLLMVDPFPVSDPK